MVVAILRKRNRKEQGEYRYKLCYLVAKIANSPNPLQKLQAALDCSV